MASQLTLPPAYRLEWTGQYEFLAEMEARLRFMDYNLSPAVWVGLIAVAGVAAETGIVMAVYLDEAFARYMREGRIRKPQDVDAAVVEGTAARVRPLIMTVATTVVGLLPPLWEAGVGADVSARTAAPVVGGLWSCMLLTCSSSRRHTPCGAGIRCASDLHHHRSLRPVSRHLRVPHEHWCQRLRPGRFSAGIPRLNRTLKTTSAERRCGLRDFRHPDGEILRLQHLQSIHGSERHRFRELRSVSLAPFVHLALVGCICLRPQCE